MAKQSESKAEAEAQPKPPPPTQKPRKPAASGNHLGEVKQN